MINQLVQEINRYKIKKQPGQPNSRKKYILRTQTYSNPHHISINNHVSLFDKSNKINLLDTIICQKENMKYKNNTNIKINDFITKSKYGIYTNRNNETRTGSSFGVPIYNNEEILLVYEYAPGKKFWSFPGGGIDNNENRYNAAAREMSEEVNEKLKTEFKKSVKNKNAIYLNYRREINDKHRDIKNEILKGRQFTYPKLRFNNDKVNGFFYFNINDKDLGVIVNNSETNKYDWFNIFDLVPIDKPTFKQINGFKIYSIHINRQRYDINEFVYFALINLLDEIK